MSVQRSAVDFTARPVPRLADRLPPRAARFSPRAANASLVIGDSPDPLTLERTARPFEAAESLLSSRALNYALAAGAMLYVAIAGLWNVMTGKGTFFVNPDNVHQAYPWYQELARAVHAGYLPLWDAGVLSGHLFVGEFQTGVFYLPNLAFALAFGSRAGLGVQALEWLVIAHFLVACAGMFWLARTLGFSAAAGAVTAILFAFSGAVAHRAQGQTCIFFGDALIPIAVCLALKYKSGGRWYLAVAAGLVIGSQILAGHFQPPAIALLLCAGVLLGRLTAAERLRSLTGLALLAVTAILLASPQLILGFQYLAHAYRWVGAPDPVLGTSKVPLETFLQGGVSPGLLVNFLNPRFEIPDGDALFLGAVPVLILFSACFEPRTRQRIARLVRDYPVLFLLGLFGLLMLLGSSTPLAGIVYFIPFASSAIRELGRYALLVQVVLVLAIGAAVDAVPAAPGSFLSAQSRPFLTATLVAGLGYAAYIALAFKNGDVEAILVLAACATLLFAGGNARVASLTILVAVEAALLLPSVYGSTSSPTYAPRAYENVALLGYAERCYPECRIMSLTDDVFPRNAGDVVPVQTILGDGATMSQPYFDLLSQNWDVHGFVDDVLNVRYAVSNAPLTGLPLVARDPATGNYLYARPSAFPRAFSYAALAGRSLRRNDVAFKTLAYADEDASYQVTVPRDETVVFSEQFYPGWSVSVDERAAPMLAARVGDSAPILRSVFLTRGTHRVRFRYTLF